MNRLLLRFAAGLLIFSAACSESSSSDCCVESYGVPVLKEKLEAGLNPDAPGRDGAPLIFHAIRDNNIQKLEILLSHGADPNLEFEGIPALLMDNALFNCNEDVVRLLLRHGADANETGELEAASPLSAAVVSGEYVCVELVLESGGDPSVGNSIGETPLHVAAQLGRHDLLRQILSVSDRVDYQSGGGFTPLHYALYSQDFESALMLLEAGADCALESSDGTMPFDVFLKSHSGASESREKIAELCRIQLE